MLTEAEQNRLVIDHAGMVEPIVARFRGKTEIPFEELRSVGMAALVKASRRWLPTGKFAAYADDIIDFAIRDFVAEWENMAPITDAGGDQEKLIYEWQNGFFALYERWENLAHSPWDLRERFQDVQGKMDMLSAAYRSLSKRDRQMVEAYFLDNPRVPLGQIAKDHRMSYRVAQNAIWRALGKMKEIVAAKQLIAA